MNSYTFHINLYDLAFLGAIFIGLTFALLLWFTKTVNRSANRFLALALATMILWMIRILAIDLRLETYLPHWDRLPMQFLLALGPLVYFYVLKITLPQYKFSWRGLLHFSPLLLEQATLALEIRESARTGAATYVTHTFQQLNPVLQLLIFISIITYLHLSDKLIQNFYRRLQPVLMDRPLLEFRWLRRLLAATALLWLLWLSCAAVDYFGYRNQLGIHVYYPFYIFFVVINIWTAAAAFLKPQAAVTAQTAAPVKPLIPAELRAKGAWLKRAMEANQYYQDPELSLSSLAEKLSLPPHELSRVINMVFKKGFSDFVNEYRVIEAARKMQDPAYDRITLLGIGFESGFNSKTTFNRIFKQMTGKSPTEYKNHLEKERPSYNLGRQPRPELLILNRAPLQRWVPEKLNSKYMFRNYLKIAWRNLIKNKVYSGINVLGLAAGMAVAMLIGLWIWDEVTYDRSFTNHHQLAQVMTTSIGDDGSSSTMPNVCRPIAEELRSKYGSDFKNIAMATWSWGHALTVGDKIISAHGPWVEDKFPMMFSLNMLKGNINALNDPSAIIINASMAKTLFGNTDPMGKIIRLDNKDNYKVAGVFRDFPDNSTLNDAKYFLPWKKYVTTEQWVKDAATDWYDHSWLCFAQLAGNIDMDKETGKIKNVVMAHKNAKTDGVESAYLYPMDKWHLYSEFKDGKPTKGAIQFVWLFSIIGSFVLLLACINFMNLSTARSEKRAKEVGIRKALGSLRSQLIRQFLSESVLVAFVSFIFSILLVIVLLPLFNSLSGKNIQLPWFSPAFWLCTLAFTGITGLLSGSYPALYLSKFEPIKVLKGTFKVGRYASLPRKVLVVAQFTFSIALIIGTVIVFKQIQFAKNRPINYRKEGLITVGGVTQGLPNFYDAVRNDLLATGVVDNMAGASDGTTYLGAWRSGFNWAGKNPNTLPSFGFMLMTEDFGKTIGWQLKEGRDFSKGFSTDSFAMILNEAAVKQIGMKKDIVGQNIQFGGQNYRVIGVVKDIVQESPYHPVAPMVYVTSHIWIGSVTVALKTGIPVKDALAKIEKAFKKYNPNLPFTYTFNDEDYARKFADEQRVGKLATFFTILAIFISCLGLFGLASFVAEQRKKEIGVRKVLGASTYKLWQMLSREFALLVIISCFIAIPLAWYYSNNWLQQYDYRTSISAWVYVASGVGALVITLITVSFQAIKAALANPVKSLRTD
ncbi:MAG TPA: ABC transporter permease [Puia sp.]|nr:ABC transporter permease [Puia sp.]